MVQQGGLKACCSAAVLETTPVLLLLACFMFHVSFLGEFIDCIVIEELLPLD